MRQIKESDYTVKTPDKSSPTLADIIEAYCYAAQEPEADLRTLLLVNQCIDLIDYLTERLISADSSRFS